MTILARILAPVEFSERCAVAVRFAGALARHFHSELLLLHVVPPSPEAASENYRQLVAAAEGRLREFGGGEVADLPVRYLTVKGDPARKIVQSSQDERIQLIVMPTRGVGRYRRFLLGSTTAKVLHDADCAVCTGIHLDEPPAPRLPFRHILCAVDLGPQSENAVAFAVQLQNQFAARLTLAHATSAISLQALAQPELEKFRQQSGCAAELLIEPGEPARVIADAAARLSADAVVIGRGSAAGTSGRLRTNAYAILRESPCPVFSV